MESTMFRGKEVRSENVETRLQGKYSTGQGGRDNEHARDQTQYNEWQVQWCWQTYM